MDLREGAAGLLGSAGSELMGLQKLEFKLEKLEPEFNLLLTPPEELRNRLLIDSMTWLKVAIASKASSCALARL